MASHVTILRQSGSITDAGHDGDRGRKKGALRVVVSGAGWAGFAQAIPMATNLALTPFIIVHLGQDEYGLFLLVLTLSSFLSSFDGGIGESAGRYFAYHAGVGDRRASTRLMMSLLPFCLLAGLLTFALLFFAGPAVLHLLKIPERILDDGAFLLRTSAIIVSFGLIRGLFTGLINAHQRYALVSCLNVVTYLMYAVGMVWVLEAGLGLRGAAWIFAAQSILASVVIFPQGMRYLEVSALRFVSWTELKEFFSYSWRVQVVGLVYLIIINADSLIVASILPIRMVGIYGPGASFAIQLRQVLLNGKGPLQNTLTRTYAEKGMPALLGEFRRLQRFWVLACSCWLSAAAGCVYFAISAWLGPEYRLAGIVALVLTTANIIIVSSNALLVLCQSVGKPGIEVRYASVNLALNILLSIPLTIIFGILGLVSATAVAEVVAVLYLIRSSRRRIDPGLPNFLQDIPVLAVLASGLATAAIALSIHQHLPQGPVGLILAAAPGAVGVCLFILLVFPLRDLIRFLSGPELARLRQGRGFDSSREKERV